MKRTNKEKRNNTYKNNLKLIFNILLNYLSENTLFDFVLIKSGENYKRIK